MIFGRMKMKRKTKAGIAEFVTYVTISGVPLLLAFAYFKAENPDVAILMVAGYFTIRIGLDISIEVKNRILKGGS
jgi:hypothetical protein